jgi:hypothetical protein
MFPAGERSLDVRESGFCIFEVGGRCFYNNFRFTIRNEMCTVTVATTFSRILCYCPIFLLGFQSQRNVEPCVVGAGSLAIDYRSELRSEPVSLDNSVGVLVEDLRESLADGSEAG